MKKFLLPVLLLSLISTPCLSEDGVEYRGDRIANVDAKLNCLLSENMFDFQKMFPENRLLIVQGRTHVFKAEVMFVRYEKV